MTSSRAPLPNDTSEYSRRDSLVLPGLRLDPTTGSFRQYAFGPCFIRPRITSRELVISLTSGALEAPEKLCAAEIEKGRHRKNRRKLSIASASSRDARSSAAAPQILPSSSDSFGEIVRELRTGRARSDTRTICAVNAFVDATPISGRVRKDRAVGPHDQRT